jgi:hypothetical protein
MKLRDRPAFGSSMSPPFFSACKFFPTWRRTMINKSNNSYVTLSMNNAALIRIRRRTLIVRAWIVFSFLSFAGLFIVASRFLWPAAS